MSSQSGWSSLQGNLRKLKKLRSLRKMRKLKHLPKPAQVIPAERRNLMPTAQSQRSQTLVQQNQMHPGFIVERPSSM
jgi:hypothetical protein